MRSTKNNLDAKFDSMIYNSYTGKKKKITNNRLYGNKDRKLKN